ncbi:uncharacterized protein LOC129939183 [Eupeodes corollae]|uniref:uncharacterized protein LOC129939183 n=1 Tax=Eupeodes corollae TaxID=290404 RepID=UPI002490BC59|nr:uncharacterized protein LOC129939183 [Eupeodes corollae]XP_055903068.1 uncharacterized protein LOC129939183 [Eupeodes corollae]XP_055903071.1 uncharacterized protein LOC129939183 [Eupeodes corollae]XP_055903072.1 uncharacterized protein LOC129939183 [Eupeodes corollae]XP_055903073.1 uncharacterized protein LOC129939183 [Eupeodes corollae]XP_055903074.1 uncharacterized protein LOC129939183 [Eupeodes corollae]
MRNARKFLRRLIWATLLLFFGVSALGLFFNGPREYGDNKFKLQKMEESIKSPMNQGECKIPDLPIDNPEIMAFYKETQKIDCGDSLDDWVTCEKSICFVKPEITATKGEVICSFTDIIRKTDYKAKYGKVTKTKEPYVLQQSDFVKVVCSAQNGDRWYGMASGIRDTVHRSVEQTEFPLYNVLMLGFDSLSRNAFMRKLPKTYEFLVKEGQAMVLQGYNIVGDGTPQALIPILTGRMELELPETRKRKRNSVSVNAYPMIWKEFERYGYVTSFNEDLPKYGTFTYRMNGFDEQPTDHYLRTFYLELENIMPSNKKFCIGYQPGHLVMLDYTRNFMAKYSDNPRFVFSFHGELSHDSINIIGSADDDLVEWLTNLKAKRLLDDTILIVMSDHGNRFSDVRNTLQGKQEERLPFFSFAFPESFKNRHPQEYRNFQENVNRLTTPFDIHETLLDILNIQSSDDRSATESSNYVPRGISLFKPIPQNRSCASAFIEPHWCACLDWRQINDTSTPLIKKIAQSILTTINDASNSFREVCEPFELKLINWALKLTPHRELLKFRKNKDIDGFLPDLSSDMDIHEEFYQVQVTLSPGDALFEASVSYNLKDFQATTKLSQVSRVNKYGSQANCIYDTNPELRKYCYCK